MEDLTQTGPSEKPTLEGSFIEGLLALVEVAAVAIAGSYAAVMVFAFWGIGPMDMLQDARLIVSYLILEACLTLSLIKLLLSWRGSSLAELGWSWSGYAVELRIGLGCLPILFLVNIVVTYVFNAFFPQYVSAFNPLLELVESPTALTLFLFSSLFVGGIKEETQRAFALVRFERGLGSLIGLIGSRIWVWDTHRSSQFGRRAGLAAGLILWTIIFGAMHLVQGLDNAFGAGILGLLFGLIYIWRRSLIAPMVSHALFNMTALLIFWANR